MTAEPASILARVGVWAAELRERAQIDAGQAQHLAQTLADAFGEGLDQPEDPLLVVMLCGPTAVGKSSLINALAGAEISRPGHGATTGAAVVYVHEADDPARLYAYSQALGGGGEETLLLRHRRDALLHTVLVDTPDIDSVRLQHQALTARLVHAADLVLFVTSPEKYKVLRAARWVREQRGQRALAFVLNKWDRAGLGIQAERRGLIETDFRQALAGEGFAEALVFRVSALEQADGLENDLPALRAWLEQGLDHSTAATIRRRRLRAAWGRLASVIAEATPPPLSAHPLLPGLNATLRRQAAMAEHAAAAEAAVLETAGLEDGGFPPSPGLLGMARRFGQRMAVAVASVRGTLRSAAAAGSTTAGVFGARPAEVLRDAATQAVADAMAQGVRLALVQAAWTRAFADLAGHLATLPLEVAGELALRSSRLTLRRVLGGGFVYAVEGSILAVLAVALVRGGTAFMAGSYAPARMFVSVLMLVLMLTVIGQTGGSLFFPPLRQRLRRTVAGRARALVQAAAETAGRALAEQAAAVDRLSREGHVLLADIDAQVMDLAARPDDAEVKRLFAEVAATPAGMPLGERKRPVFD